jgi:hypothetical protein
MAHRAIRRGRNLVAPKFLSRREAELLTKGQLISA